MYSLPRWAWLALFCTSPTLASPPALQWLGLFNWDMIAWLDNPNRLHELCPENLSATALAECSAKVHAPQTTTVRLFDAPNEDAEWLGSLIIIAIPGKGLFHAFKGIGQEAHTFTPDLYEKEWNYGPYYHQTISAREHEWIQLPPRPFPQPVWLKAQPLFSGKRGIILEDVSLNTVYLWEGKSIVLTALEEKNWRWRPEQPSDMPCEADEDNNSTAPPSTSMSYSDLFDRDGHLKLQLKYTRGC
jgi:hypothetical protein